MEMKDGGSGEKARLLNSPLRISLTIPGKPQQWSRASRGQNGPSFTPGNVTKQMDLFRLAWQRDGELRFPDATPLQLHAGFFFERPKSHYRTGKNAHLLRDGMEDAEPISRPDIDNLVKLIGDSLSGMAFDDDARITLGGQIEAFIPRGTSSFTEFTIARTTKQWRRLLIGELNVAAELFEEQM